jgi:hypothetical protein
MTSMEYMDMTTYKEGSLYTLSVDYYHSVTLQCTYLTDDFVYFIENQKEINYKKNLRNKKLYMFNEKYQSWDTVEDSIKPLADNESVNRPLPPTHFQFRGD